MADAAEVSGFARLDAAMQFSGVNIEAVLARVERRFHNEVAERGGDDVALRLAGKWLAGVEYREWLLLAGDRKTLMAEVERLNAVGIQSWWTHAGTRTPAVTRAHHSEAKTRWSVRFRNSIVAELPGVGLFAGEPAG